MKNNYPLVRLGEICDVRDGTHDSPKYHATGIPLITSKNLKEYGIDFSNINYISNEDHKQIIKRSLVNNGDILFGMIGTIGNPVIVDTDMEFSIKNMGLIKFINNNINNYFLKYYLQSPECKKNIQNLSRGGTQKFVSLGNLRNLQIPLPPLSEQSKIVDSLDFVGSIRQKRKICIKFLDDYLKAEFLEIFGDPVKNPKGWKVEELLKLVSDDCPLTYGIVQPGEEHANGTLVVRPVDLVEDYIGSEGLKRINPIIADKFKRTRLKGEELLLSVRGTTGVISIARPELKGANVTRGITPIWFSENYNNLFAFYQIRSMPIQQKIKEKTYGIALQQINLKDIRTLKLINPPISLQNKFAEIVQKTEMVKQNMLKQLDELNLQFQSLMQRSFASS